MNNTFKFRYIRYSESVTEGRNGRLNELDLLYGKTFGSVNQFNISGGIGVLQGYDYATISNWPYTSPTYINKVYHTLNIPVEISISIVPIRFFGLGITGYCNINFKKPIFGIVGKMELGKIR